MRAKPFLILGLAAVCGLVAAIGITQVISRDSKPAAQQGDTRTIIVAAQDISPGTLIKPEMVKLDVWPRQKVPEDAVGKIDKVAGCRARSEIYADEPIRDRQLLGQGLTRQTATDFIPKGYRVVGVKVDMVSGAGLIQPGDRVDVLVNLSRNPKKGITENRTQTILQDIKVFAVEDRFKMDVAADEEETLHAKVIQLLVTPEQAETLVLAQQLGKVQLTMRPPGGEDTIKTPGITPHELLSGTSASDRKREREQAAEPKKSGLGGITSFLDSMKQGTPQTVQQAPTPQADVKRWNMRVLSGSEMNNVMMQESVDPESGESFWMVNLDGMQEPPAPPPAAEPQEPAPAQPTEPEETIPSEPTE